MVIRRVLAPRIDFGALRRELGLPETYPEAAQREADEAAAAPPRPAVDCTDVPLVTIDPPGSRDLDQAMHLSRRADGGYRVRYAIADVAAHVRPGSVLEDETWRRGQTVYLPDGNVPLHPYSLGEGAASLLPDVDRAAVLWTIDLDADGDTSAVVVQRALVRSRAQLAYPQVQADADAGRLPEPIALLPEIGALLTARGLRRGAVNLPIPEQDVEADGDGWRLVLRAPVPMEEHNAQISLLTGMAAADLMLAGGIGLLRTMPAPKPEAVQRLRAAAAPLGVHWPDDVGVGELLLRLDPAQPRAAAFIDQAAELMRAAAYTPFDGEPPEQPAHGGVAAAYAHVTAPLRRLADRYATEICLALHDGREVPDWARAALPRLPSVMAATDRTASAASRGAIDLAEAVLLANRVGETFDAAVLDVDAPANGKAREGRPPGGTVALDDPPVRARCLGELPLGTRVRVRLVAADPATRSVAFELA
ncbi:RNB domain-containing ribonuclease [Verrucosispora sp. WMMD703]|uniref:Ribonuclease R n=1 Tax=Micromonospora sediminimaris TaxID=547162 RepID=A0A9W5US36_9ACTN|nr:RNB domain-containing ribonuclease [Micromonospora sediminimaris]GIJ34739.1 ribonuclease R [Micromonospora sediminimaris]SFB81009.1 Exoribonuclease R [Micromonospora sediminimaris]